MKRSFPMILVLLLPLSCGVAHADPDADYLAMLEKYGFNVTADTSPTLVKVGHLICADLRGGATAAAEADALFRILPKASFKQVGNLVSVAQMELCPDTQ